MRARPLAAALLLAGLALAAPAGAAGSQSGSYVVNVLPDPSQGATPYYDCRPSDGTTVADRPVGVDARQVTAAKRGSLSVTLQPSGDWYVGPAGTNWRLAVFDSHLRRLAAASGPVWTNHVKVPLAAKQRVWVVACNTNGFPEATVTWSVR